jgi:hypothetical protein
VSKEIKDFAVGSLEYWKNQWLGKVFEMEDGDFVKVVEYRKSRSITVEFLKTGFTLNTRTDRILEGKLKDRLKPSVNGVGIIGECVISTNQKHHKEYRIWEGMLDRCYNPITQKKQPAYTDCSVSEFFLYYPNFKEWCNNQTGFGLKDDNGKSFALDKDILVKGNKVYSPETCCFVPPELNCALAGNKSVRGALPQGVTYNSTKTRYRARIQRSNKWESLGAYDTPEEAFYAYKPVKEAYIKDVANKWKDQIDPKVYEALIKYEVEITD